MPKINLKLVTGGVLPEFKHSDDACCDCYARIDNPAKLIAIPNNTRCLVNLGFCLELPKFWEAVVRPRSGNSMRGIDIAIGTVDSNYRGEVKAQVINHTGGPLEIRNGDRICQLAIREAPAVEFVVVDSLNETERGTNGFGSTGIQ